MSVYGPINLKAHAILDALLVLVAASSPWLLGSSENQDATRYTFIVIAIGMGLNLVTDYPLGIVKKLAFKWHRVVEWLSLPHQC